MAPYASLMISTNFWHPSLVNVNVKSNINTLNHGFIYIDNIFDYGELHMSISNGEWTDNTTAGGGGIFIYD